MSQPLLEVQNLSCERGYRALFQQLSFSLQAGQLLQIAGENGTGKSTLLKILAGLTSDFQGELLWRGQTLADVRDDFLASTCYLGHAKAVKQRLTIEENLEWFNALYPHQTSAAQQDEILKQLRLYRFKQQACGQLSAGQQQRVALARLLISQAKLWILDEPFTAIDKQGVFEFEQLIAQQVEQGVSVILTTHHHLQSIQPHQVIELGVR